MPTYNFICLFVIVQSVMHSYSCSYSVMTDAIVSYISLGGYNHACSWVTSVYYTVIAFFIVRSRHLLWLWHSCECGAKSLATFFIVADLLIMGFLNHRKLKVRQICLITTTTIYYVCKLDTQTTTNFILALTEQRVWKLCANHSNLLATK